MLRKEFTMAMLDPLFAVHKWDFDEDIPEDMFFIEIDDCDCEDCNCDCHKEEQDDEVFGAPI